MKTKEYYRLSSIVDNFMIENDLPDGWYAKSLVWANRGMREVSLDVWQDIKTVLQTVTDRKTVELPDGFVNWVKIAIKHGQYAITLGVNDELTGIKRTTTADSVAGLASQHQPNGINFAGYSLYNYNGGEMFSVGAGLPSKGYFKIVDNGSCKEIALDYDYAYDQVYIEYITDGLSECADPYVSPLLYDYLMCYMDHKYESKNNPKATESSIFRTGRDLFFAEKRVRARRNNIDFQSLMNLTREATQLTPKM